MLNGVVEHLHLHIGFLLGHRLSESRRRRLIAILTGIELVQLAFEYAEVLEVVLGRHDLLLVLVFQLHKTLG